MRAPTLHMTDMDKEEVQVYAYDYESLTDGRLEVVVEWGGYADEGGYLSLTPTQVDELCRKLQAAKRRLYLPTIRAGVQRRVIGDDNS